MHLRPLPGVGRAAPGVAGAVGRTASITRARRSRQDSKLAMQRWATRAGRKCWGPLSDRYARYFLAVQAEAQREDPAAVVLGYAYANYVEPPRAARLNERIIIGVVPPMYFPWTDCAAGNANRRQWEGWGRDGRAVDAAAETGCSTVTTCR